METIEKNTTFKEWMSAEEMHNLSKKWLSELNFIKDEHHFFEDLVNKTDFEFIEDVKHADRAEIIDAINRSQKRNNMLTNLIKTHINALDILVDGKDELAKETHYKNEHTYITATVNKHLKNYNSLKSQLLEIVKDIRKVEKQRQLINRKDN